MFQRCCANGRLNYNSVLLDNSNFLVHLNTEIWSNTGHLVKYMLFPTDWKKQWLTNGLILRKWTRGVLLVVYLISKCARSQSSTPAWEMKIWHGDNMRPLNMHVLILAAPMDNWVFGSSGAWQMARELTEGTGLSVAFGQDQGYTYNYGGASTKT